MSFQWDWEKRELVEGERPSKWELPGWCEPFILPGIAGFMWVFIQYIAPWLGRLFFGNFL